MGNTCDTSVISLYIYINMYKYICINGYERHISCYESRILNLHDADIYEISQPSRIIEF